MQFLPGVNAIVGPNGSGKSNVIEAIRWASHTARTRELRARSATELIFHGSLGKSQVNLAEVEVELESLTDSPELFIRRRLYRDGESELEVAGQSVRVRDLHELLRGSGLGPGGVAVVGQGEVGAVVGANPETMLGYLEESAGLSKATFRRTQTIDRLKTANEHLLRLEDLATEVRLRVEKLAEAASAATLHEQLSQESITLERAITRHRIVSLTEEIKTLDKEILAFLKRNEELLAERNNCHATLETSRQDREHSQQEYARQAAQAERISGQLRLVRERITAADSGLKSSLEEQEKLQNEQAALNQIEVSAAPSLPNHDLQTLQSKLDSAKNELGQALNSETNWRRELDEMRQNREAVERLQAEQRVRFAARSAERHMLESEREIVAAELQQKQTELQELHASLEVLNADSEAARRMLDKLEREASGLSDEIAETATRLTELKAKTEPLTREQSRLENARDNRTHFTEGPRKALQSGVAGILGPVADLLRVPPELETAVGAALGRRLEHIVVEHGTVAEAVIEHLKRVGGRATFLALDLLRPRSRRKLNWNEEGVLGFAADLVQSEVKPVLESLLGDTVVVRDLKLAVALARATEQRPRIVTLDGELIESGGAITGGKGREVFAESFAESRRLREITEELEQARQELTMLEKKLLDKREAASLSHESISQADARHLETRNKLEQARSNTASLETRCFDLADRRTQFDARLVGLEESTTPEESELPQLASYEEGLNVSVARLEAARAAERQAETQLLEARSEFQLFEEQQRTFAESTAKYEQAQTRIESIAQRLEELNAYRTQVLSRLEQSHPEVATLETELASLGIDTLQHRLNELTTQIADKTNALELLNLSLIETQQGTEARRLSKARREANLETLQSEHPELDGEEPEGTPRTWAQRLSTARAQLLELGLVNPLAAQEHLEESTRLTEMETGIADARAAAAELEAALEALERDVTAKLREAIMRVSDAFRSHIRDLLGGEGELETVRDEAGALLGLALQVTPKGKRTRAMHLLSAGERTMAALAFIFALAHASEDSGGLPLAVLDEVDAPLDEANIRRFTHFLKLLAAQGTQFVLVTHQKATMEVADSLWGVTTDAGGVSRVYSIKQIQEELAAD